MRKLIIYLSIFLIIGCLMSETSDINKNITADVTYTDGTKATIKFKGWNPHLTEGDLRAYYNYNDSPYTVTSGIRNYKIIKTEDGN